MQTPSVTGFYLALLALIYAALALEVARLRRGNRVCSAMARTSGCAARSARMRISSNMCRSSRCLVAMLEMSGRSAIRVHVLMGALLVARLLHPLGMYSKTGTWQFSAGRVGGIMITISVLIAAALSALSRFWPAIGGH